VKLSFVTFCVGPAIVGYRTAIELLVGLAAGAAATRGEIEDESLKISSEELLPNSWQSLTGNDHRVDFGH